MENISRIKGEPLNIIHKGEPLNIIHSKSLLTSSENIFNKQLTVNQTRSNGDSKIKMENILLHFYILL